MPKKGQTRGLPTDLRLTVAENVKVLLGEKPAVYLQKSSGVGRRSVLRLLSGEVASTLDTIQAIAKAFDVPPYLLLMKGAADSYLRRVFSTPAQDDRLGQGWTRPDRRKPLLSSDKSEKNSARPSKIKMRG